MSHPLLKTFKSYLEESYENDLVESILEEVSEETWEAIEEAILNELSPELLQRYHKKATKDAKKLQKSKGNNGAKNLKKADSRLRNAELANHKFWTQVMP